MSGRPCGASGPGAEHLVDGDVAGLEPERGGEHVQPPDALALGADLGDRVHLVGLEVREPGAQRQRVVLAQRLDVADLEPAAFSMTS